MTPKKAGSRMRPGAPLAGSPSASPLLTPFLLLLLAVVCTAVSASDPPQFEERPRDQTVTSDRVASFTCRATGNPEPNIQWRKNGRRFSNNARLTVLKVPGGSILRIEPVKYQRDEASYECVVENPAGDTIKASANLQVLSDDPASIPEGFPYFRTEPKTKAVEIDHTALLVCDARGTPDPTITWYKDHRPVDLNNPRYTVLRSGSLQISTSTEEDGGKYECVAENSKGTAFSNLVSLYVRVRRVPPRFSMAPEPVYEVMPGASLSITCVAVGSPMPYVQWKKDMTIDMTENLITKNVLQLDNIQESANYTCQAQSTLGLVTKDVAVKVQALPRPPDSLSISEIMSTSVRVTWSYDVNPSDVSYYVLQYKPRHADRDYTQISGLVTKFYTVINLTPFTDYEFQVLAVNKIGQGPPSEPAYVTTGETGVDMWYGYRTPHPNASSSPHNVVPHTHAPHPSRPPPPSTPLPSTPLPPTSPSTPIPPTTPPPTPPPSTTIPPTPPPTSAPSTPTSPPSTPPPRQVSNTVSFVTNTTDDQVTALREAVANLTARCTAIEAHFEAIDARFAVIEASITNMHTEQTNAARTLASLVKSQQVLLEAVNTLSKTMNTTRQDMQGAHERSEGNINGTPVDLN